MLKQLRTNTKWIMIAVVVGFVAMIVFQWGMDITSQRQGVDAGVIGSVNGEDIYYTEYDELVRNQTQALASGQRQTMDQLRQIHNEVWDYLITQALINQEIEKRGITFTDQELIQYIRNNPAQYMDQIPAFLDENGQFSISLYRQFLDNPQNLQDPQARQILEYIETEANAVMPSMKLQNDLAGSIVVTDEDIYNEWLNQNETRGIDYMHLGPSELSMVPYSSDDDALRAYYNEHKNDFSQPERRAIQMVLFSITPTAADSTMIRETAEMLVQRIRGGEDFAELADAYTEDPGNTTSAGTKRGGDLGFFSKGQMVAPFENAAFSLDAGEISDPIETDYGIHVIQVDSLLYSEDGSEVEQVKARHILLTYEPSGETQQQAENGARAFFEEVDGGADFEATAERDGLLVQGSPLFAEESQMVPNIGTNADLLMKRIFDAGNGDVMPMYTTDNGYYVIRVSQVSPAGIPPFENVRTAVLSAYIEKTQTDYAAEFLASVETEVSSGMSLQDAVDAVGDTLITASVSSMEIARLSRYAGLPAFNTLTAHVFDMQGIGDCTGPVRTSIGVGLAVITDIPELDSAMYDEEKETIRSQLTSTLQNEVVGSFLEGLRENAKIVDNRTVFLSL